jgi:hypothetical protein
VRYQTAPRPETVSLCYHSHKDGVKRKALTYKKTFLTNKPFNYIVIEHVMDGINPKASSVLLSSSNYRESTPRIVFRTSLFEDGLKSKKASGKNNDWIV